MSAVADLHASIAHLACAVGSTGVPTDLRRALGVLDELEDIARRADSPPETTAIVAAKRRVVVALVGSLDPAFDSPSEAFQVVAEKLRTAVAQADGVDLGELRPHALGVASAYEEIAFNKRAAAVGARWRMRPADGDA